MSRILVRPGREKARWKQEEPRHWDEDDPRALYDAVNDACWIYRYRNLRENLRKPSWKQARKRVLAHGALSNGWASHCRGDVRLRRRGLEVRFRSGTKLVGWRELQEFVRAERF